MQIKHNLCHRGRSAFSLLELMIVIIIISLVYALTFTSMQKKQKEPKSMRISNLKSTLFNQGMSHTEGEFFCIDKCATCYLYRNGETSKYEGRLALGKAVAYHMGSSGKLEKTDFGRYHDHPVCLRFKLHHNGSSSQMVIQNQSGIYYIPAIFGETVKTASLEEAEKLWLKYSYALEDRGEYY